MSRVFTITDGLENMGALRSGGQASVYKGRRQGYIFSAVKVLPTPIADENNEDKHYRNFINEVEKLKKVNEVPDPNVVKILSSGITESGSLPFIEMEYIEGPDLGELLTPPREKIFTIKETINVAEQLASALAHCHSVGVKHGDIKSNNVKYNIHSGNYVLIDFGLSVMSDEQRRSSMRNAGAIEFMAPEQNRGEMLFQTDIYSYGIILYELLTGQVPFPLQDNGETARNAVMISHLETAAPDLSALRIQNLPDGWDKIQKQREAKVPAWLVNVIYKCLEKDPSKRFENGTALHEAILQNSLAASPADDNTIALQAENETLQLQLAQYQERATLIDRSSFIVSKSKVKIAAGLFCLLLAVSIYGMTRKEVVYYPAYTSNAPHVPFLLHPYHPPVKPAVVHRSLTDSTTSVIQPAKKKPKRKKFLGIF